MNITLLYFASLREQLGVGKEELALPAEIATVGALRELLMAREDTWRAAFSAQKKLRVAVNQDMAQAETLLKPGDEVAFFPPVTGG